MHIMGIMSTSKRYPMTEEGLAALRQELHRLKTVERPKITQAIAQARELGDLSENAEYHAAREKQSFLETRVQYLEDRISHAQIIDVGDLSGDTVKFGARVLLIDGNRGNKMHYRIVGAAEADLEKGHISVDSPLAKALIGRKVDDQVDVSVPGGERVYKIGAIEYGETADTGKKDGGTKA